MTDHDIIDIAARAMYTQGSMAGGYWDDLDDDERHDWRRIAEAGIRAHADKYAPKDGNEAKQCLRRHLLIAARVADGRPTLEEAAQAFTQWAARIAEGTEEGT